MGSVHGTVKLAHLDGCGLPSKVRCTRQAALLQFGAPRGVGPHMHQTLGNAFGTKGVYELGGVPSHFRKGAITGGDDGRAAGHRLNDREAEAFIERGEGYCIMKGAENGARSA